MMGFLSKINPSATYRSVVVAAIRGGFCSTFFFLGVLWWRDSWSEWKAKLGGWFLVSMIVSAVFEWQYPPECDDLSGEEIEPSK